MNRERIDRVASAVLYEGYTLYPYRPSVKSRQRWTFGGLYPESYCRANGGESSGFRSECLVRGCAETVFAATVRFLHLTSRVVGKCEPPERGRPGDTEPKFQSVESLQVGDRVYHSWQEAEEREIAVGPLTLGKLTEGRSRSFFLPAHREPGTTGRSTVIGAAGGIGGGGFCGTANR